HPSELLARAEDCDALLINFISGHELDLEGAEEVRRSYLGPIYGDLHSLFLDTAPDGTRHPRRLPRWRRWVACFDAVQVNESEMDRMRGELDADEVAGVVLEEGCHLLSCTRGSRGAVCWFRDADWPRSGSSAGMPGGRPSLPRDARVERYEIPARAVEDADPTGCGDVWGAVLWSRLLAGDAPYEAAATATRLAGVAAASRGTAGLGGKLKAAARDEAQDQIKPEGGGEH
ncbi:MAG: PfkB family carbohydrate kinase, partial [Longimicrobiales bacterium]|nr:PfkB family carbohydrate kinase [Longimicrobiales bacterium]